MVFSANDLLEWKDFPKGLRVLLLDQDANSASDIKSKLQQMEYIVSAFFSEHEAISAISSKSEIFHVAIVEVNTRNSDDRYKFIESTKDVPTIMTSDEYCLSTMMRCIALGAVEFLMKPLSEDKLRNIWQHVVHKAFKAGGNESTETIAEFVGSVLDIQQQNLASHNQVPKEVKEESEMNQIQHHHESNLNDKFPAPSTPQLKQGGRIFDDQDSQEQTNVSPIKDSQDQASDGSLIKDCKDQTNDSPAQVCRDQTNGSPVIDFQDQTNGSPVKHCQDQTNGSPVIDFQDQTNGSPVKHCQDQTNGSPVINFQDQTNGSSVKDCQDQTNGSSIIDFQDQTNGSLVKDCQDQTNGSPIIDFQDQTNGSPVKDCQDQTNVSPVIDFQDQTNGPPVKDYQDQTNGSPVIDFQDQTNGSPVKDCQDQTNGSVKDFQDQTNGSAVKDRQDQTNGSPISDSGEFDKEAKSADNTCSDSVTKMEIDPPQVVTEIVIKDEGGCDHGSERMHECDLSSKRQNGDQMDIIDSPGTMEKSNKAFTPQNAKGAKGNRKKVKVDWTPELHKKFVQAVEKLGVDQAIPSRILELMKVEGLTRHNIASHLQKYRMHRRHILPKDNSRRWPHPRDNRPIMAFPPYHTNHNLPPGQVYPTWGQPPHFSVWGPPNYLWQPVETWQWKHTYTGVHADAWGCPVLPPPPSYPQPATTFPDQVHGAYGFHNQNYADPNPGEEIIDKVVKEAMNKPWLPLPIGLNPPSTDSVLAELSRQGISAIPSHINGHHSC